MHQYPRYWKRHRRRYDLRKRVDLPVLLVVQVALLLAVVEGEAPLGQDLDDAGGAWGRSAGPSPSPSFSRGRPIMAGFAAHEDVGGGGVEVDAVLRGEDVVGDEVLDVALGDAGLPGGERQVMEFE